MWEVFLLVKAVLISSVPMYNRLAVLSATLLTAFKCDKSWIQAYNLWRRVAQVLARFVQAVIVRKSISPVQHVLPGTADLVAQIEVI